MPGPRRLWDSSVVIGYLAGEIGLAEPCGDIIAAAERGELQIALSIEAAIEVAYLEGYDDDVSERIIRELLGREYIIPITVDLQVAAVARDLIRRHKDPPKIHTKDATHLATAILWKIPVMETTDRGLLRFSGLEGNPAVSIRPPLYEGPRRMSGFR
jgi:predicted nucleic acid-binding protein